ncbi:hypothetical protein H0G86_013118 [Trichoderma simmonsii]|uniref:Uncharacterized protein n=1 Tax=Trichoderma simmonsii TaxID=1491479 RepID=A0A8G0LSN8_9HYPO|nr:hypothetical protein H0G86_013118 [Trichoderma simmonsii]
MALTDDEDEDEDEHSYPYPEGLLDAATHGAELDGSDSVSVTVPPSFEFSMSVRVE